MTVSFTHLDPPSETTFLRERVSRLKASLDWAGEALTPQVKAAIRETVRRCEERLALGVDTTIVALAGGTGSGKSSLFNAIVRLDFALAGVSRPTTAQVSAATWGGNADPILDWLGVDPDRRLACETALDTEVEAQFRGMILLDLPDHDSVQAANREIVDRVVPMADLLIWVVDPQKYADHALHSRYLTAVAESGAPSAIVLNHTDRLTRKDADAVLYDIRRLLAEKGIESVPVLMTSATTGAGVDSVRSVLANVARRRSVAAESVRAELVAAGRLLANALAKDSEPALPEPMELATELAKAAGVDVRAKAAGEVAAGRQAAYPGLATLTAAAVSPLREAWVDAATDGLPRAWRLVMSNAIAKPAAIAEAINDALGVVRWPEVKPAKKRLVADDGRPVDGGGDPRPRARGGPGRDPRRRGGTHGDGAPGVPGARRADAARRGRARGPRGSRRRHSTLRVPRRAMSPGCARAVGLPPGVSRSADGDRRASPWAEPHRAARPKEGGMNDLIMTVNGWVATEPSQHVGPTGARLTSFRLASTSRFFDRDKGEWTDGRTEWFTVKVFRNAAITVANSIKKGQPVTVHGRFRTNEWESDGGTRTDLVIDATSVGHDLTRGTAEFTRAFGDAALGGDASDAEGSASDDVGGPDDADDPDNAGVATSNEAELEAVA